MSTKKPELLGRVLVPFFADTKTVDESVFSTNDTGQPISIRKFNKDGNFEEPVVVIASEHSAKAKKKNGNKEGGTKTQEKYAMSNLLVAPAPSTFPLPKFGHSVAEVANESGKEPSGNQSYLFLRKNGVPYTVPLGNISNDGNFRTPVDKERPQSSRILDSMKKQLKVEVQSASKQPETPITEKARPFLQSELALKSLLRLPV